MPTAPTKKRVIVYVGTSDVREIDAAAWRQAGVDNQGKVVWDKSKGFEVPESELTADAIRYCEERDDGFVVREVDA